MSKRNTRQLILDTALVQFNEYGAPNVSTNQLADALDISPGNLYYHFKNRADIVTALFDQFEQSILNATVLPDTRLPDAEDIWFFLHLLFERQIEYRFWYRDLNEICGSHPGLKKRFQAILELQQQTTQQLINRLANAGVLHANALQRATLSRNILLTLNCWLSFSAITPDSLSRNPNLAVWQVLSQVSGFLNETEQYRIEALAKMYLR